jgi:hypothetical protein
VFCISFVECALPRGVVTFEDGTLEDGTLEDGLLKMVLLKMVLLKMVSDGLAQKGGRDWKS